MYEYLCSKCGAQFELIVAVSERDSGPRCPQCGKKGAQREVSTFAMGKASAGGSAASPSCGRGGFS